MTKISFHINEKVILKLKDFSNVNYEDFAHMLTLANYPVVSRIQNLSLSHSYGSVKTCFTMSWDFSPKVSPNPRYFGLRIHATASGCISVGRNVWPKGVIGFCRKWGKWVFWRGRVIG